MRAMMVCLVLQAGGLGGDQAQHDLFALGHVLQRLKVAGALVVELQVEGVHVLVGKQDGRDGSVAALAGPGGVIVAAAHMGGQGQVLRSARNGQVVQAQVLLLHLGEGKTAGLQEALVAAVAEHTPGAVVKLDAAAAGSIQVGEDGVVGGGNVLQQLLVVGVNGIGVFAVFLPVQLRQKLRRGGHGLAGDAGFVLELLDEFEVLHKGMIFAGDFPGELMEPGVVSSPWK